MATGPEIWVHSNHYPAWSPDGKKIVFQSNRSGIDEIYRMNADGSNQKKLTKLNFNMVPNWGPKP